MELVRLDHMGTTEVLSQMPMYFASTYECQDVGTRIYARSRDGNGSEIILKFTSVLTGAELCYVDVGVDRFDYAIN